MRDLEHKNQCQNPIPTKKAITKSKHTWEIESLSLDSEHPVDDIIIKCLKIHKILKRSSRAIKQFTKEIKLLNQDLNQVFRPVIPEPIFSMEREEPGFYLLDHRQVFDRLLVYSDVSEVDEPNECNTSFNTLRRKFKKRRVASRKIRRSKEQLNQNNLNGTFEEEVRKDGLNEPLLLSVSF